MLSILVLLASLLACPHSINAWGAGGHAVAADIAQTLLTPRALNMSATLLNQSISDVRLSAVASWADTISSKPQYLFSKPLHYVNQPPQTVIDQCHYEVVRDCPATTGCVDSAVHNYTARSINHNMDLTWEEQNDSFKFLIHFVEDLHQPLHAGFTTDSGGNKVSGKFNKSSIYNLHSLWDSGLINYGLQSMYNNNQSLWTAHLLDVLANTPNSTIAEWLSCPEPDIVDGIYVPCSGKWTNESALLVCQYSYQSDNQTFMTPDTGFNLGKVYFDRNFPIIESQLIKAAVRLAYVINQIAPEADVEPVPEPEPVPADDDNDDSMWIIIAAIAAVSAFILLICCGAYLKKRMRRSTKENLLDDDDGISISTTNYSNL